MLAWLLCPARTYTLTCPGCSAEHELVTGEDDAGVLLEQYRCARCKIIDSGFSHEEEPHEGCSRCSSPLVKWSGRAWLELNPDGTVGPERIQGPCPRCGTELSRENPTAFGFWD